MDWIIGNTGSILDIILQLVGAFSIISTMTPNDADNRIADNLLKFINLVGGNFGKSTNA
jgi:hypothetical protein|tara:strand:- start:274 stop:450 length:177 start_codon:yes stop_codon:yes gene_type:complete